MPAAVQFSHPFTAHQAQTAAAAQQMPAPAAVHSDAGADVAARLQRIEALAADIARAQVCGAPSKGSSAIAEEGNT